MKAWEKNIRRVVPYVPGEQPQLEKMIKLNTNENPYPPSPKVMETKDKIENLRLYPDPTVSKLVNAIAAYHGLEQEQVFVGVGSDDVLAMSFLTFFNSEKPILFPDITYSFYDVWANLYKIPYKQKELDENFRIRKEDYIEENGGVIFPNPNARSGDSNGDSLLRNSSSDTALNVTSTLALTGIPDGKNKVNFCFTLVTIPRNVTVPHKKVTIGGLCNDPFICVKSTTLLVNSDTSVPHSIGTSTVFGI